MVGYEFQIGLAGAVRSWRGEGLPAAYTLDAGPNVHVICPAEAAPQVEARLRELPGVSDVLVSGPGGPARLLDDVIAKERSD